MCVYIYIYIYIQICVYIHRHRIVPASFDVLGAPAANGAAAIFRRVRDWILCRGGAVGGGCSGWG